MPFVADITFDLVVQAFLPAADKNVCATLQAPDYPLRQAWTSSKA